jgi:hypothetical protein
MTRTVAALAVAMLLALLGAGCGSDSSSYADPSCPAVLNVVSLVPPGNSKAADQEVNSLQEVAASGQLGTLTGQVESALQSFVSAGSPGSASYRAFQVSYVAAVKQVQHYCAT